LLNNVSNADFLAYLSDPDYFPRVESITNSPVVPGQPVTVPVMIRALGNERAFEFSVGYDPARFAAAPTVDCGISLPGCIMTTNFSVPGRVGITVVYSTVLAGNRQIARLNFQTLATSQANTPITFESNPKATLILDGEFNPLGVNTKNGFVVFQQGPEADVAPLNEGDSRVTAEDVDQLRQFVVGSRMPDTAFNEFQRADTAPRSSLGDGTLSASDVIQVKRYAFSVDPMVPAGGDFGIHDDMQAPPERPSVESSRVMRVHSTNASAGAPVAVIVELDALGDEVAANFALRFDSMKLTNPRVALAPGSPGDAVLTVNTSKWRDGELNVLVDSSNTFEAAAARPMVTITFDVAANAPTGGTAIAITGGDVANSNADSLSTAFRDGAVTIGGPNSAGVDVEGRVLTASGSGLRNAQVSLVDQDGNSRTITTSSLGYFRFTEVAPGQTYTVRVASKRYRFVPQTLAVNGSVTDLIFIAQE
jgi:hypothetical protein